MVGPWSMANLSTLLVVIQPSAGLQLCHSLHAQIQVNFHDILRQFKH